MAGALLALVLAHMALVRTLITTWSRLQLSLITGLDQVWIFDSKYTFVMAGMMVVWLLLFLDLLASTGWRTMLGAIPFQLCAIGAAGVLILPDSVLIPGYQQSLAFIAERMSLGVGVCACAFLEAAQPSRFLRYAPLLVALVFFGFLYRDERALNAFEDRMQAVVAKLPPGQRVVSAIRNPGLRIYNPVTHMMDRVCIERCYSYANYEPSSGQFRIRADRPNPFVVFDYQQSWDLQTGTYMVRESDAPLYQVDLDADGQMVTKPLPAGVLFTGTYWNALSNTPITP
jgi:hypothetical protein